MKAALLSLFVALPALAQNVVPWRVETSGIPSFQAGDPALTNTFIIGTDTAQVGAYVYDLDGGLLEVVPFGISRSADVRGSLAAVSTAAGGVRLFTTGTPLVAATPASIGVTNPGQIALGSLADGGTTLWVDTLSTVLRHYDLEPGTAGYTVVPQADVTLTGVPSGLAYDDLTGVLYAAVPGEGVVAVDADGGVTTLIATSGGSLGTTLGGIALLQSSTGLYFFTTAPSDDSVVVHLFDGAVVTLLGSFQVGVPDGGSVLARLPAYLDVSTNVLGYPAGALLVHDGINANYKLVGLDDVAVFIPLSGVMPSDGGTSQPDAGSSPDAGGGSLGEVGGPGGSSSGPSAERQNRCSTAPLVALPALLLLWWIRRPRS